MTEMATTPRKRTDPRQRIEVRLSASEYRALQAAAEANLRSPAAQARVFIARCLRHQRHQMRED
jgi:hypothetical protein